MVKKRKLLEATYRKWVDASIYNKPVSDLEQFIVKDVMGYGTAIDEKILSDVQFMALLKNQQKQAEDIEISAEETPILRKISADENTATFVDEFKVNFRVAKENNPFFLRITTILEYVDGQWKVIHWHGTKPNDTLAAKDAFHTKEWDTEKAKLEQLVAEKTADLIKKNRELEIEAALECVRTRTMAMQTSEELTDTANILFQQLNSLGGKITATGIGLCQEDNPVGEFWMGSTSGIELEPIYIQHEIDPTHHNLFEAWKRGEVLYTEERKGHELKQHYQNMMSEPSFKAKIELVKKAGYQIPTRQIWYTANFKYGFLLVTTTAPYKNASILPRFAKVFKQTYTRFLDLQKAETQARGAQIEAALERVRARTMAMHKSEELSKVAATMFKEFYQLNLINEIARTVININDEENGDCLMWLTQIGGAEISTHFEYNYLEHELWEAEYRAYQQVEKNKRKTHKYIVVHEGKAFEELMAFGIEKKIVTSEDIKVINEVGIQKWIEHIVWFAYGSLVIARASPLSEEDFNILQRFTVVFEQTYTRFLDLQKAEAQAREAQIEAALERVRAKAMSMHKSEDLADVLNVIFEQMHLLGFDSYHTIFGLIDLDNSVIEFWSQGLGKYQFPFRFEMPIIDNYVHNQGIKDWQSDKEYSILEVEGNTKKEYDETLFKSPDLVDMPEMVKSNIRAIKKAYFSQAFTQHGILYANGPRPLPEENRDILVRFAKVLDLTYTRMLDLQKAENQAHELEVVFQENERLLHSILPMTIAEQLKKSPQTIVKRFEQVSILFADIVGFTILSEKLSPQKLVDILNGLFSKFDDLTDKYQLEKIKTIGDAYMVASGVPEEKENHAFVLFQFAQEMLEAVQTYNQIHNLLLEIRIGISSGPVIAGVIGKKKFAYDLWGDTVNTAARMEAYGQASCIQAAPASYEILKKDFAFEKIPNVEIKGKGKMDVYLWKA